MMNCVGLKDGDTEENCWRTADDMEGYGRKEAILEGDGRSKERGTEHEMTKVNDLGPCQVERRGGMAGQ